MASNTAILSIKILADAKKAVQGLTDVEKRTQRIQNSVKKAAVPAAAFLGGLAAGSVAAAKAASEDERAQKILAKTLENATGATRGQIAATEDWIDKQARATGIADDELRPALGRLVTATEDVGKAQELLALGMDVAIASGKPLSTVTDALAKAAGGQFGSLKRLVPSLSDAAIKSGDLSQITQELSEKMGGSAATAAETSAGKIERLKVAADEFKESLGAQLLPALEKLVNMLSEIVEWAEKHPTAFKAIAIALGIVAAVLVVLNIALWATTTGLWAMAAALWANPITWIVAAVIALIAVMVVLYKKNETFRNVLKGLWEVAKMTWNGIRDGIKAVWGWIVKLINKIKDINWPSPPQWMKDAGSWVGGLFGGEGSIAVTGAGALYGGPAPSVRPSSGSGVTIIIQGAVDPVSTAKQIERILARGSHAVGVPV
jgi:hypothetical protein